MYILFERYNDWQITVTAFIHKSSAKAAIDEGTEDQKLQGVYYHYRLHDGTGFCESSPNAHVHFIEDYKMRFVGIR